MATLNSHTQLNRIKNTLQKQQRQRSDCASASSDLYLGCSLPKLPQWSTGINNSVITITCTAHKLYCK